MSELAGESRPFRLDAFQEAAIHAVDAGQSVLVAAPTGAGKTVVAEHAVARARRDGVKAFYTTPIKALSNQKYQDLVARHGRSEVGLLTGDNAINGTAPVVVMTTEVLRNMIYARSPALDNLRYVILDEVHYLQDAYRGPVWEEVIIHLPPSVRLVCLSATVSNADELAEWIAEVRGPTATVIEHHRPVELDNLYLVGDRGSEVLHLMPTLVDGRPNPHGERFDVEGAGAGRRSPGGGRGGERRGEGGGRGPRRFVTPRRVDVVDLLAERHLLPAIYFIFSRAACDEAATACLLAGVRLTERDERRRIRTIVEDHVAALSDADLDLLGYQRWLTAMEAGVATHHAGMVPPFKEAVEACFVEGLVKVVFATETLALGINMPARTVVIEKLTKFNGDHHQFLTPGEYTQLTGRAGRRGIDHRGHAVVLWSPWVPFADVAGLASSRRFPLASAFRPTYNMAVNLVRRYEPERAHELLQLSFAQFQADRAVVRLRRRLGSQRDALTILEADARCDQGDVAEYVAVVDARREERRRDAALRRDELDLSLRKLRPGQIVGDPSQSGRAARSPLGVISVAERKGGAIRLRAVARDGRVRTLSAADFRRPPDVLGRFDVPMPFAPQRAEFRQAVVDQLPASVRGAADTEAGRGGAAIDDERHPVAGCPDRDRHVRAQRRIGGVRRDVTNLERQISRHTGSLVRRFDTVLRLLEAWDHLDGWALTRRGDTLARIYHEADLLVAEALLGGLFDDLAPAEVAGLASCLTYEHRSPTPPPPPWYPDDRIRDRVARLEELSRQIRADEERLGLPLTRPPDPTFVPLAYAWALGSELEQVLEDEDLSAGDFVRNVKQLVDLLRQFADAAPQRSTGRAAAEAADRLVRGVVAASSAISPAEDPPATPAASGERRGAP